MNDYSTVTIDRETMQRLDRIAQQTRLKKTAIVALAVTEYEKSIKQDPPSTPVNEQQ